MDPAVIREAAKAIPFRPFLLRQADGSEVMVRGRDYIFVTPNGLEVVVYDNEERTHFLQASQLVSLVKAPQEGKSVDPAAIREAMQAVPFRPFRMRLVDGREVEVQHPDFISISPSGRQLSVYDLENHLTILEPLLIVSLKRELIEKQPDTADDTTNGKAPDAPA